MRRKTRGECFLVTLAGLGCLMVVAAMLVGGGYFYYRRQMPIASTPVPASATPEAPPPQSHPALRIEGCSLGEDQAVLKKRFPKMVLKEAQTLPLILKGFSDGDGSVDHPAELYFYKNKLKEVRFATTLEVNGRTFRALDKPTLETLNQALGTQGVAGELTPMSPTFWFFEWEDQKLVVTVLDRGHYFSLSGTQN